MKALMRSVPHLLFDAAAAETAESNPIALLPRAQLVTWQTYFGTNPDAISITLELSNDGTHWNVAATTTTITGALGTIQTSAKQIRAVIGSITAGDEITVNIVSKPVG